MSARLNFLCVNGDSKALARSQELAADFHYSFGSAGTADEVQALQQKYDQVQFVLISAAGLSNEAAASLVKSTRQTFKESFICVIVGEADAGKSEAVRKSSASLVLFERDFYETSRIEFAASQIIRASFVPVKLGEFPKDSVLDFTLYHLLPLNQKVLPIVPKGTALDEARLKKLSGISEVYVRRDEVDRYRHYVEAHPDSTQARLRSRCRAQYLSFSN